MAQKVKRLAPGNVPPGVLSCLVNEPGIQYESTAEDPTDAIAQLLSDPLMVMRTPSFMKYALQYYLGFDGMKLKKECQVKLLDAVKAARHTDVDKSKPRQVRRKMQALSNDRIIDEASQPLTQPVRGTVCLLPNGCTFCRLVVAVADILESEISDTMAAFGGRWGHDKMVSGVLPFTDVCCREGHSDDGMVRLEPVYRVKRKAKVEFVKASSPCYRPTSPIMLDDGEVIVGDARPPSPGEASTSSTASEPKGEKCPEEDEIGLAEIRPPSVIPPVPLPRRKRLRPKSVTSNRTPVDENSPPTEEENLLRRLEPEDDFC